MESVNFSKNVEECLKKYGEYSERFFALLPVLGQEAVIKYCIKKGLLASSYECPKCGNSMKLSARTGKKATNDRYEWRCRKQGENSHDVSRSVRKGTFFERSNLDICSILTLLRKWFGSVPQKYAVEDLGMSAKTAVDWYHFCRESCEYAILQNSCKIGGQGVIVEIEESEFGTLKYGRGQPLQGTGVYGGVERGTNRSFFVVVQDHSKERLLRVIEEWVLPGTTIVSDCWTCFDCLNDVSYEQLRINNSLEFVSPAASEHPANSTESTWSAIKRAVKGVTNHSVDKFDSYVYEYMWRRSHGVKSKNGRAYTGSVNDDVFEEFLRDVIRIYPPATMDQLAEEIYCRNSEYQA